ncbi:hypothetical protein TNCV_2265161 [Trichonephila clavipes]|nr:hypothetical protein TNCV_2265161 [Trichonephila clavipes]
MLGRDLAIAPTREETKKHENQQLKVLSCPIHYYSVEIQAQETEKGKATLRGVEFHRCTAILSVCVLWKVYYPSSTDPPYPRLATGSCKVLLLISYLMAVVFKLCFK